MKKKLFICFMAFAMVLSTVNISRAEEKSPILAGVLSWLLPGLGQYYNGRSEDITKGLIIDGVFVLGIVLIVVAYSNSVNNINNSITTGVYTPVTSTIDTGMFTVALVVLLADGIFGIVDAVMSADDINKHGMKHHAQSDFGINTALLQDSSYHMVPGAEATLRF